MEKIFTKDELFEKISLFNSMFIESIEKDVNTKSWGDYINPICQKLFHLDYLNFIKTYNVFNELMVESFDKYFNFFHFATEYFKTLTMIPVVNQIYICCNDILNDFYQFIKTNGYHIRKHQKKDNNLIYYVYEVYPLVK